MTPAFLMAAGMALIPVGDALAREAVATGLDPAAVAFARFVIGAVLVLPVLLWRRQQGFGASFAAVQLLRGGLLAVTILCIVTAVSRAPLAQVFGAFFIGPPVAALVSVAVLGERPGWRIWAAIAGGFLGVSLVLDPWSGGVAPGLGWALAAGAAYGLFLAATRGFARFGPPLLALGGQLLVGALLLAPFGAAGLSAATTTALGPLILSGLASALANLLAIAALSRASAAMLSPIVYIQLPVAVLIGGLAYGERPGVMAALGLCMILAAGAVASMTNRSRP